MMLKKIMMTKAKIMMMDGSENIDVEHDDDNLEAVERAVKDDDDNEDDDESKDYDKG